MKTILLALLLAMTGQELMAQTPTNAPINTRRQPRYVPQPLPMAAQPAAAPANTQPEEMIPPGMIDFQGVDVIQVLEVYAKLVNRTILRGPLPEAKIILKTQTPLTKTEAIEALQAVLAMNNISIVNIGDKFVKVLQSDQANSAGGELDHSGATNLPNLGSYVTHITQLKYVKPTIMVPLITPFAKLPGSIFPIDDNGILVIRDYAENVKRMLEMIDQIDVSVPAEYISEVIPIRYAKVEDIASALNSLGGSGGGSTVSIGSSQSSSQISGFGGGRTGGISGINSSGSSSGFGGGAGGYQSGGGIGGGGGLGGGLGGRTTGATGPNGTPTGGSTFAQRLNNIVNRAGGNGGGQQDQIQLFGQTKIIPDDSSSSLLVFATRQDMAMIKEIIAKLDVPLAQVLVEAVIMDVTLGSTFNFAVSAQQNPKAFTGGNITNSILGGGGINNGPGIVNFVNSALSSGTNGSSGLSALSGLPGGFSYFGNIGPTFDVAVQAAETDNHASIIQRPRIQTSQAKAAQFFVGETRPYVTSTYNNGLSGGYGGSSYSQLSVGVELDVTPYINPDGEVTMDIQQEIDDFNGTTTIAGVGDVPNTIKRTLNTTITIRDRDTVMLGGFIKSDKSIARSGVPFLQDIPLLGNLFSSRSDAKDRQELIVLMRPTVLKTPELAAKNTIKEAQRLPGVSGAAAEDAAYERKLIDAERRKEEKSLKEGNPADGFFNMVMPDDASKTNATSVNEDTTAPETPGATSGPLAPAGPAVSVNPNAIPDTTNMPTNVPAITPPLINAAPVPEDPAAAAQEKARLEYMKKSGSMDAPQPAPAITPAQKVKLDVLLNSYAAGKITREEYQADKARILAEKP